MNHEFTQFQAASGKETAPLPIILELNHFANLCGYFYNAHLRDGISANNGYNCCHPKQEEVYTDDETGKETGCCYCWSCPLGYAPSVEDAVKYSLIPKEDAEIYKDEDEIFRDDFDYVIVDDAETIHRLHEKGITGLAERANEA